MIKAQILVKMKIKELQSSFEVSKTEGAEPVQLTKGRGFVIFKKGDQAEFDWYNFVAWGKLAEVMNKICKVDQYVLLQGELRFKQWTTKEGEKRFTPEIRVTDFDAVSAKEKDEEPNPYDN